MRLWSFHPRYLDPAGLVAAWREALLARAVLRGLTRGYRNHPQLDRFRAATDPVAAVERYLGALADEADERGYSFDRSRAGGPAPSAPPVPLNLGQLEYEWRLFMSKLSGRNPAWRGRAGTAWPVPGEPPEPHPSFEVRPGGVEPWERVR